MACSSCRKAPRIVRTPSTATVTGATSPAGTVRIVSGNTGSQKNRITGLAYVPAKK